MKLRNPNIEIRNKFEYGKSEFSIDRHASVLEVLVTWVFEFRTLFRISDFEFLLMQLRTPITLITGPLGSGKTTLLRHILATHPANIAVVMNEFGEIAIDTKIIEGKNIRIAELGGGCVCCSLLGEFEAAITEIIEKVAPDMIIVETTGLAEPESLVFNIPHALPHCPLYVVMSAIHATLRDPSR